MYPKVVSSLLYNYISAIKIDHSRILTNGTKLLFLILVPTYSMATTSHSSKQHRLLMTLLASHHTQTTSQGTFSRTMQMIYPSMQMPHLLDLVFQLTLHSLFSCLTRFPVMFINSILIVVLTFSFCQFLFSYRQPIIHHSLSLIPYLKSCLYP